MSDQTIAVVSVPAVTEYISVLDSPHPVLAEQAVWPLRPDIIDLTMIPPPITPEEDGLKMKFPATINEPPTPFAGERAGSHEVDSIWRRSWSSNTI